MWLDKKKSDQVWWRGLWQSSKEQLRPSLFEPCVELTCLHLPNSEQHTLSHFLGHTPGDILNVTLLPPSLTSLSPPLTPSLPQRVKFPG